MQPLQQDHPRVCGENSWRLCFSGRQRGSPPRVRGKPGEIVGRQYQSRITPACAGKTQAPDGYCPHPEDHPRVCGENLVPWLRVTCWIGSPPRVRGKLRSRSRKAPPRRITPACAGKTKKRNGAFSCSRDHPRVCGENLKTVGNLSTI